MGLRMKNFNIFAVHRKIQTFRDGGRGGGVGRVTKNQYRRSYCLKKAGLDTLQIWGEAWQERVEGRGVGVFDGWLIPQCTLCFIILLISFFVLILKVQSLKTPVGVNYKVDFKIFFFSFNKKRVLLQLYFQWIHLGFLNIYSAGCI